MHKVYDSWHSIAEKSFHHNFDKPDFKNIDHIVFGGMGGSGAIGDLLSSILSRTDIHVSLVKGYLLPKTVDSNTLVVTTSVSGNTDEVLTLLSSATNSDCKLISFSSGGLTEQFCNKNNLLHYNIPQNHSPRASFIGYVYSLLNILETILPIKKSDILDSLVELKKTQSIINSSNLTDNNESLNLAKWIKSIPLIYYPNGLHASAIRFKSSLQENSKIHVIAEDVIEACHNGIVSWEQPSSIQPIFLRGQDDYVKTQERWEIIKEFFGKKNIEYKEFFSVSGNILTKLVNMIYILDYASIYHAFLHQLDPTPVLPINFIKDSLKQN